MARYGIISNYVGKGLEVDANLLGTFLESLGHETVPIQFDQPHVGHYDAIISLEVVNETFFALAPVSYWIPNVEWTKPEFLRPARQFTHILAKTRDAETVLRERFSNVTFTGFLSRDRYELATTRESKFLHIGGDSGLRGTNAVLSAWREYRYFDGPLDAQLTIVSRSTMTVFEETPGVTLLKEVSDDEIARLQNSHLFHLQPSSYEGYGHVIHEAQSVGAVLLTTGAGPMSEIHAPFEIEPVQTGRKNLATLHTVSGREVREKVRVMLDQPSHVIYKYQLNARANWEQEQDRARERLQTILAPRATQVTVSAPQTTSPVRIALIGNFEPEHSTENDLKWSLTDMGHTIIPFQENRVTTETILHNSIEYGIDLLIYVHTHGWSTPGRMSLDQLWDQLRANGIQTCSFHLDRYWGLNIADRREELIGKHAFWHTDRVFTVDGANDSGFAQRGVRHTWLPPAIAKKNCVRGVYRADLASEVGFVGATSYHPEYPFREELIFFLRGVYGSHFRVYQGYRGEPLADVYASCAVVVGDSCFAGAPRYWSDRIPETLGRAGFLVHPLSEGMHFPGLVTYEPQNLLDLQGKIDYYLGRSSERDGLRFAAQSWVTEHSTYHNRMEFLLKTMRAEKASERLLAQHR